VVSLSDQGYERFEQADSPVIKWLNSQLLSHINSSGGHALGSSCYHLKGRGGIKKAIRDLRSHLDTGKHPFIIRSDAKSYYAHIRHHKLVGILNDNGLSREVCHVTTQLCQRTTVRGGIYSECQQGIPLGCAASPALAAIYLSPLDKAISKIPGVKYLRYMDDWIILCPSRWKMRRAVKLMHQILDTLGLRVHPDKTFIGKVSKGFDFLGVQFSNPAPSSPLIIPTIQPSSVAQSRLRKRLDKHLSQAAQLYEQGRLHTLARLELHLTHWLRYQKGIGVASSAALNTLRKTLQSLCSEATDVMIPTFSKMLMTTFLNQQQTINKKNENTHIKKTMVSACSQLRSFSNDFPQPSSCHRLL
jgi:hypothetical protein